MIHKKMNPQLTDIHHAVGHHLSHQLYNAALIKLEPAPEYKQYDTTIKVVSKDPNPGTINELYVAFGMIFVKIDDDEIIITHRNVDSLNLNPVLVELIKNSIEHFAAVTAELKW